MIDDSTSRLIHAAIDEDLGPHGDLTSRLLSDPRVEVTARLVLRKAGVPCGAAVAGAICDAFCARLQRRLSFTPAPETPVDRSETTEYPAGTVFGMLQGEHAAVLAAERTVLNFLSRLGGVATLTRRYVEAARAASPRIRIYDTRKTIPGWRALDKYAVRCGGGHNHRFGLFDAVLIKDNHITGIPLGRLAERLREMLGRFGTDETRAAAPAFVEVEVDSLAQFDAVCVVEGIDVILLDNFSLADMAEAVRRRRAAPYQPELEASGGITLENVAAVAATGVERIAVGALTHSAPGLDIGLDF